MKHELSLLQHKYQLKQFIAFNLTVNRLAS